MFNTIRHLHNMKNLTAAYAHLGAFAACAQALLQTPEEPFLLLLQEHQRHCLLAVGAVVNSLDGLPAKFGEAVA